MGAGMKITTIEYRCIPDWPGYLIGSDGSVWSCKIRGGNNHSSDRMGLFWRELSQSTNSGGYPCVGLSGGGKRLRIPVCYLVLLAFVGARPDGMEVCHYPDADRRNSCIENLRWDTPAENAKDRWRDRIASPVRQCRRCRLVKPVCEMSLNKQRPDGLSSYCRKCNSQSSMASQRKAASK